MGFKLTNVQKDLAENTAQLEREVRKRIVTLDQAVVSGTPVDTGRARANWFMDFGTVNARLTNSLAIPDTSRGNAWTIGDGNVYIHNSVEYILILDAGRIGNRGSFQAEQGILDPAVAAFRGRFG